MRDLLLERGLLFNFGSGAHQLRAFDELEHARQTHHFANLVDHAVREEAERQHRDQINEEPSFDIVRSYLAAGVDEHFHAVVEGRQKAKYYI